MRLVIFCTFICLTVDVISAYYASWGPIWPSQSCSWTWTKCSKTCGGGTQHAILARKHQWFVKCSPPGPRECGTECCPEDGMWSTASELWSQCSVSCGGTGHQTMTRKCIPPKCGGKPCVGKPYQVQPCNNGLCTNLPKTDCSWATWGTWTICSKSCDGGTQTRRRTFSVAASSGGKACSGLSLQWRSCNTFCCPFCPWSEWGTWSSCTATCGLGIASRKRKRIVSSPCGIRPCFGPLSQYKLCQLTCCAVDCEWGSFGNWSTCSKSCGGGSQSRYRPLLAVPQCGGTPCTGNHYEDRACNEQCCPSDCEWGEWGKWSECSLSCGSGISTRTRKVAENATCGGADCVGPTTESKECNTFCCPKHCEWIMWTEWSACSASCGVGEQSRSRTVVINPDCVSQKCEEPIHETRSCNEGCCPVDCEYSGWSDWSGCSATCGATGTMTRYREIATEAECGGKHCDLFSVDTWEMESSGSDNETLYMETVSCNQLCLNNGLVNYDGCLCTGGWEGSCCEIDIDECALEHGSLSEESGSGEPDLSGSGSGEMGFATLCYEHASCHNTPGSYVCICDAGFTGDGSDCQGI